MRKLFVFALAFAVVGASIGVGPTAQAATQYATVVADFNQGMTKDGSAVNASRSNSSDALGAPDSEFVSLGFGGSIELMFASAHSGSITVTVSETTGSAYPLESAEVEVSENGSSWTSIGTATNQEGAGETQHDSELSVPEGMCVQFVRLTDTTDSELHSDDSDAFDVDSVSSEGDEGCEDEEEEEEEGSEGNDTVHTSNNGVVINNVSSNANTGGNHAGGSEGGDGGDSGNLGNEDGEDGEVEDSHTGNGGGGGDGAEGGLIETGDATATSDSTTIMNSTDTRVNRGSEGGDGNIRVRSRNSGFVYNGVDSYANSGYNHAGGSEGGDGGDSGNLGNEDGEDGEVEDSHTGNGGGGGDGSVGGTVRTGRAESNSYVLNLINRSTVRINR